MTRDGSILATIDGNSTSWTDPNPVPGATHDYRVAAVNVVGLGEASDAVMVDVFGPLPGTIATVIIVAGAAAAVVAIVAWVRAGKPRLIRSRKRA